MNVVKNLQRNYFHYTTVNAEVFVIIFYVDEVVIFRVTKLDFANFLKKCHL